MSDTLESETPAASSEAAAPAADTADAPAAEAAPAPPTPATDTAPAAGDTSTSGQADAAAANPMLSQEHLDWTSQFCGVPVGAGGASAPGGSADGAAAPGGGVLDSIADGAKSLWNKAGEAVDKVEDTAKDIDGKIEDGVEDLGGKMADVAKDVGGKIEDAAKDIDGKIEDGVEDLGGKMADVAKDVGGKIEDAAKDVGGKIEDGVKDIGGKIEDTAKDIGGKIEDEAKAAWDKAGQVVDQVKKKVEGVIDTTVKTVSDGTKAAWDEAGDLANQAVDKAKEIGSEIEDKVKKTEDDVKDWWNNHEDYAKAEPPLPKVAIGAPQQDRANKLLGQMSDDEKKKVQDILDKASPDAKTYLTKALASKHSAAELEEFAKKIEGKDQKWMDEHLHLVGASDGRGIKQQWADSCGPTTVQAMKGELDPMYSLKMHEDNANPYGADNSDGTAVNPDMAKRQKDALEAGGGVAVPRDQDTGAGMPIDDLLNAQQDKTGVKFDAQDVENDDAAMTKGLDQAEKALKSGLPVPVRVGDGANGHFVLMTGVTEGPPRTYGFHDPYKGINQNFTEDQIKKKQLDIAGWTKVTDFYQPTATGN